MPGYWGIRIVAGIYILFCIYIGLQAMEFPAGGGKFPLFAEISAILICGAMIAQSFTAGAREKDVPLDFRVDYARAKPILLLGMAILYVLAIFELGYFSSTLVFLVAATRMVGIRSVKAVAITAIVLIPAMYGFFVVFLKAPLPKGILF